MVTSLAAAAERPLLSAAEALPGARSGRALFRILDIPAGLRFACPRVPVYPLPPLCVSPGTRGPVFPLPPAFCVSGSLHLRTTDKSRLRLFPPASPCSVLITHLYRQMIGRAHARACRPPGWTAVPILQPGDRLGQGVQVMIELWRPFDQLFQDQHGFCQAEPGSATQ